MRKKFVLLLVMVFSIMSISSIVFANDLSRVLDKGKLGYGFEPGLVAGKDFVEGQLIVGIKEGMVINDIVRAASAKGGKVVKKMEGAILLEFRSEEDVMAAVHSLVMRPDVAFVERNGFMRIPPKPVLPDLKGGRSRSTADEDMKALSVSADPGTGYQWHHTVIRKTAALPALSATPPTVAVVDTGVDYTHPDLSGKVILGFNAVGNNYVPYDDNGHGTHCAGIIAATAANGLYGEGVCPNCKILAVKVLGGDGSGTNFDVAYGMAYARLVTTDPPTKVISMSLGGPASAVIAAQVDLIKAQGKVLVAAAGNDNTTSTTYAFPGADPDTALRVMATEENDCRAYFSNFSPSTIPTQYNIAAPGWEIYSTVPEVGYSPMSGTSMATPVVAGAAALVWGQLPALTRAELVNRLLANGKTISCGFAAATKRVDVRKAITGASETAVVGRVLDPFTAKAPAPPTNPANVRLYSGATLLATDQTDAGGSYEMTGLTSGPRALTADMGGYISTTLRPVSILAGYVVGPYTDAISMARSTGNATIQIDWKNTHPIADTTGCIDACNGWELDLFVKLPDNTYIYWDNTGDLMTSPYAIYARDSYIDLEPLETIVIGSSAANGVYKVFVDKYDYGTMFNPSWTGSGTSASIFNGITPIVYYLSVPATCGTNEYWHIGNLTKSGTAYTWTLVNTCTNTIP